MPGERHPGQQREHRPQAVHDEQDGVGPPQTHCRGAAIIRVSVAHGDRSVSSEYWISSSAGHEHQVLFEVSLVMILSLFTKLF